MMNYIRTQIQKWFLTGAVSYGEHLRLQADYEFLKIRYETLEKRLLFQQATHKDVPVSGFDSTDDEPSDVKKRVDYVRQVSEFSENILHSKLKVSVAEIRHLLSNIGRSEDTPLSLSRVEYDMFLRGMEAMAWKIHEWTLLLDAEHKQYLQDKQNKDG